MGISNKKAILITAANIDSLGAKFNIDPYDVRGPEGQLEVGMYIVTDFGNEETFEILTEQNLDVYFTRGEPIENGWFEVVRLP